MESLRELEADQLKLLALKNVYRENQKKLYSDQARLHNEMRILEKQMSSQSENVDRIKLHMHYTSIEPINRILQELEWQVKFGNYSKWDQRQLHNEINKLKSNRDKLPLMFKMETKLSDLRKSLDEKQVELTSLNSQIQIVCDEKLKIDNLLKVNSDKINVTKRVLSSMRHKSKRHQQFAIGRCSSEVSSETTNSTDFPLSNSNNDLISVCSSFDAISLSCDAISLDENASSLSCLSSSSSSALAAATTCDVDSMLINNLKNSGKTNYNVCNKILSYFEEISSSSKTRGRNRGLTLPCDVCIDLLRVGVNIPTNQEQIHQNVIPRLRDLCSKSEEEHQQQQHANTSHELVQLPRDEEEESCLNEKVLTNQRSNSPCFNSCSSDITDSAYSDYSGQFPGLESPICTRNVNSCASSSASSSSSYSQQPTLSQEMMNDDYLSELWLRSLSTSSVYCSGDEETFNYQSNSSTTQVGDELSLSVRTLKFSPSSSFDGRMESLSSSSLLNNSKIFPIEEMDKM